MKFSSTFLITAALAAISGGAIAATSPHTHESGHSQQEVHTKIAEAYQLSAKINAAASRAAMETSKGRIKERPQECFQKKPGAPDLTAEEKAKKQKGHWENKSALHGLIASTERDRAQAHYDYGHAESYLKQAQDNFRAGLNTFNAALDDRSKKRKFHDIN